MSFILDALRRAESDRERGSVPGLNSQATAAVTAWVPPAAAAAGYRSGPALWLFGGLGVGLLLAGGVWWLMHPSAALPVVASVAGDAPLSSPAPAAATPPAVSLGLSEPAAAPAAASPAAAVPALAPATAVAPMVSLPAVAPPLVVAVPSRPPQRRQDPAGEGVPAKPAVRDPPERRAGPAGATPAPRPAPTTPAAPTARSPGPSDAPAEAAAPLTAADRQRLPRLQIGGAMYSDERSSRMLVVNDQLLREGDRAAPGVMLERIGPKSAQFSFEGRRFDLSY